MEQENSIDGCGEILATEKFAALVSMILVSTFENEMVARIVGRALQQGLENLLLGDRAICRRNEQRFLPVDIG